MARTNYMRPYVYSAVGIALLVTSIGCSSTTVVEDRPAIPEVPEYVKVPHPVNFELASLRAIFYSPLAPQDVQGEFSKTCDQEFQKLAAASNSLEERQKAATELVSGDPERMHWCFYGKVSHLQETLQSDSTWSQRQKKVFETFVFISPLANSFLEVYHDSRYLRWATQYYSKISEWVFFRKVTPGPDTTYSIIQGAATSNLEPWVPVDTKISKKDSVFAKYGISLAPTVASGTNPFDHAERMPASQEPEVLETRPVTLDTPEEVAPAPVAPVVPALPKTKANDPMIGY
jgi:hypothetical protein